jgi:hypothetical protein
LQVTAIKDSQTYPIGIIVTDAQRKRPQYRVRTLSW